jgi:hypothetical protein
MWRQGDFDRFDLASSPIQPHFPVYETNKTLHPIQNGLNLELNSWSPRSILCFLDNRRVIEPLEISYFFVCWLDRKQTPSSELWEKWIQAEWKTRLFGVFHVAAFSIAHSPTICTIEPFFHRHLRHSFGWGRRAELIQHDSKFTS